MNWDIMYLPEAVDDLNKLDGSQQLLIRKAIKKISANPLPDYEGGYGHPLSNKRNTKLSGFLKIKLRAAGLRIIYKLVRQDDQILIVIIGARKDDEVYENAQRRIQKYNL